jgi:hypothetical protein
LIIVLLSSLPFFDLLSRRRCAIITFGFFSSRAMRAAGVGVGLPVGLAGNDLPPDLEIFVVTNWVGPFLGVGLRGSFLTGAFTSASTFATGAGAALATGAAFLAAGLLFTGAAFFVTASFLPVVLFAGAVAFGAGAAFFTGAAFFAGTVVLLVVFFTVFELFFVTTFLLDVLFAGAFVFTCGLAAATGFLVAATVFGFPFAALADVLFFTGAAFLAGAAFLTGAAFLAPEADDFAFFTGFTAACFLIAILLRIFRY